MITLYQGWPDFFSDVPNFIKILYCGPQKKILPYFFLHKDHIIDANFGYFIHKCVISSLVVYPKFDTGAAENLWRAALWPPLHYIIHVLYMYEMNSFMSQFHQRFTYVFIVQNFGAKKFQTQNTAL